MNTELYFANGDKFNPLKNEKKRLPTLTSINGVLSNVVTRQSNSGEWVIFSIDKDETIYNLYFDSSLISDSDFSQYYSLLGRVVTILSRNERPVVEEERVESEGYIRAKLLLGVAEGTVNPEDLPALLAFSKKDDALFEKWMLFKQEINNEGLSQKKEELARQKSNLEKDVALAQEAVDNERDKVYRLQALGDNVRSEVYKLSRDLEAQIVFLRGDDTGYYGVSPDYLISLDKGYNSLMRGIEKFRSQKGIYLLCDGHIHEITHAYFEAKGRVFLVGHAREYKTTKPEAIQAINQEITGILYPEHILPDQSTNKDTH